MDIYGFVWKGIDSGAILLRNNMVRIKSIDSLFFSDQPK